jgi:hypothetical protein
MVGLRWILRLAYVAECCYAIAEFEAMAIHKDSMRHTIKVCAMGEVA